MAIVLSLELWKISSCCCLPVGMPIALGAEGQLRHWDQGFCSGQSNKGHYFACRTCWLCYWRKLNPGVLAASSLWIPIAASHEVLVEPFTRTLAELPAVPCHCGAGGSSPFVPSRPRRLRSQSRRRCRIAALGRHGLAQGPSPGGWTLPQNTHSGCTSPLLSLPLPQKRQLISVWGSEWLFCWCVTGRSMEGCVYCENTGCYHKAVPLRLQFTQDRTN